MSTYRFVIETLEACEEDLIERGERFRPLTIDVRNAVSAMEDAKAERLSQLFDDDEYD